MNKVTTCRKALLGRGSILMMISWMEDFTCTRVERDVMEGVFLPQALFSVEFFCRVRFQFKITSFISSVDKIKNKVPMTVPQGTVIGPLFFYFI